MNKVEAAELISKQAQHRALKGGFSGLAPGVNGALLRKAYRIVNNEEPEDKPVTTPHPVTGLPVSPEEHKIALEEAKGNVSEPAAPEPPAPAANPLEPAGDTDGSNPASTSE